jgi:hypothetical protein
LLQAGMVLGYVCSRELNAAVDRLLGKPEETEES